MNKRQKVKGWVSVLVKDLPCPTAFRLKAVPPYDFSLTVHKPAGWSLLTPFEIFEHGTLWTAMRTHFGKIFGLKLRSAGTVKKPEIFCKVFSHEKLSTKNRKELSNIVTWIGCYQRVRSDGNVDPASNAIDWYLKPILG